MNQQWRRNVKKAEKAGVQVRAVGPEGLDTFHALYVESAQRDNFLPRPKAYFDVMARSFAVGRHGQVTVPCRPASTRRTSTATCSPRR